MLPILILSTPGGRLVAVTDAARTPLPSSNPALRDPAHQVSTKAPMLWAVGCVLPVVCCCSRAGGVEVFDWFDVPLWVWPLYAVRGDRLRRGDAAGALPDPPLGEHRHAVYTQTGWLSRERRIAPMSRVQTVDFEQRAIGRVLGLASVTVTTASAAGPLTISEIDKPVADRLVDDLTRRTEAEAGDAT